MLNNLVLDIVKGLLIWLKALKLYQGINWVFFWSTNLNLYSTILTYSGMVSFLTFTSSKLSQGNCTTITSLMLPSIDISSIFFYYYAERTEVVRIAKIRINFIIINYNFDEENTQTSTEGCSRCHQGIRFSRANWEIFHERYSCCHCVSGIFYRYGIWK